MLKKIKGINGPSNNSYVHIPLSPNVNITEIKLSGLFPSLLENICLFRVCEKGKRK